MSEQQPQSSLRGMGGSSFRKTLQNLKHQGCNTLLCGALPREDIERVSARLLSDSAGSNDITRLFGLFGQDTTTVHSRLALTNATFDSTAVITTSNSMRSASTTDSPTFDTGHQLDVTTIPYNIDRFEATLHQTVKRLAHKNGKDGRMSYRVCVDSLQSLLTQYESERVEEFLFGLDEMAGASQCMIHSVLPVAYDAPIVKRITPCFDIVIGLRVTGSDTLQQQWHLIASGYQTDWIPYDLNPIEGTDRS